MPSFVYIEDDSMSRTVMQVMLEKKLGYSDVTLFENSENFLARLAELSAVPDIIFVDIHMEPYNGFQVLEQLRSNATYANTKIVALTASVMNEEVQLLKEAGFDGVIGKPIDQDIFPGLLNRIIKGE